MNPRISGWPSWRLIAILALVLGVGGGSNLSAQTPTLTNSLTGMVKLEPGGTQQGTLTLSSAPTMGVSVTLLSSDTDVVKLSASGSADDAMDRVTLTFTSSSYMSIPYTIHAAGPGRANIYQMMVMDGTTPSFMRLQVEVMQSKTAGGVAIRSADDDPWHPLHRAPTQPKTFDHVIGESDHVTYEVSLDGDACTGTWPKAVEIRGTWYGWYYPPHVPKRLGIREGTAPLDVIPDRPDNKQLTLDLTFADCSQSKSVTIYSVSNADNDNVRVDLTHTLVEGGTRTNGPVFALFRNDTDLPLAINFIRPVFPAMATLNVTTLDRFHHFYDGIIMGNGTQPTRFAGYQRGWSTSTWFGGYNHTLLIAPRQRAGQATDWTEFCVYVHASQILENTEHGIAKAETPYGRAWADLHRQLFLPHLTLVPAQHDRQFWWFNPDDGSYVPYRPFPDPDANGRLLPLEIQRYTGDVNGGDQCQSTKMMNHRRTGVWELVYSGGPSASDPVSIDNWRTNVKPTVRPLVIERDDYGKFINIRIRGVNGVNPNVGGGYDVRTPSGSWQFFKFRAVEMLGVRMHGAIAVRFAEFSSRTGMLPTGTGTTTGGD